MDFRQLEAFCAIVEWGNFSEASKHLYISQPTVSSHIQTLEASLNANLIDRSTKPVTLTDDGQRFYEYAKSLLRLREKALREFNQSSADIIRLGASSIPSAYILPEIISEYRKNVPEAFFDVVHSDSKGILENLLSGCVDVGITGMPVNDEHFFCSPIYKDEMVLVTPATKYYKMLRNENADIEKLLMEPYIMREDGSGTKKEAEKFMEAFGLDSSNLNNVAKINDLESIKQAIIHGLGVSILSKKAVEDLERDERVIIYPLMNKGVYRNYYLIYRKSKIRNKNMWKFIQFVENYYKID